MDRIPLKKIALQERNGMRFFPF